MSDPFSNDELERLAVGGDLAARLAALLLAERAKARAHSEALDRLQGRVNRKPVHVGVIIGPPATRRRLTW